jgi:hypothetical protein
MSHRHDHAHHHGCGFIGGQPRTRREALKTMGAGFGMMAFAQMVGASLVEAASPIRSAFGGVLPKPDFEPRAKNVIFLFMNGGVSQVDTFDPKPELDRYHGKPIPNEIKTERKTGALMRSPFEFKHHGESGIQVSELFPHVGSVADDICVINSMHTDIPNHEPSLLMMNTGHIQPGRPSLGSWLTYGLGTENQDLPGFVVLCPDQPTVVGPPLWSNGWLPAINQGTYISDKVPRLEDDFDPYALIPWRPRTECRPRRRTSSISARRPRRPRSSTVRAARRAAVSWPFDWSSRVSAWSRSTTRRETPGTITPTSWSIGSTRGTLIAPSLRS